MREKFFFFLRKITKEKPAGVHGTIIAFWRRYDGERVRH
jgi:hypothetical protein